MPARKSKKWQSRRKPSLGQLRRAHPASGATWNVQVVRGKMTSKCLWHACRALILGILLLLLGATMATVGYYADHLSMGHEIRGNATVRVKNESRGFHLNNLSYVGPIVMGFGGFIIVAACVMTFEARDSAAKVVPARFKISTSSRSNIKSNSSSGASNRRANGIMHQATRWDHHLGVFRTSPAEPPAPTQPLDRQALTAALKHFSKTLGNSPRQSPQIRRFSLSGSVPNLSSALTSNRSSINSTQLSPIYRQIINNSNINSLTKKHFLYQQYQELLQQQLLHHYKSKHHHHNHHHHRHHNHNDEIIDDEGGGGGGAGGTATGTGNIYKTNINEKNTSNDGAGGGNITKKHRIINNYNILNGHNYNNMERPFTKARTSRTSTSLIQRSSRGNVNSGSLLHPGKLHQMHRHAMSVDYNNTSDIDDSSLMSVIMLDSNHDKRIKDRNRRSDTAKRHILLRQKSIEREEQQNQNANMIAVSSRYEERRRSSTTSDASNASRYYRASSATSRTNSIDSRSIQVELHSPEKHYQNQQQQQQPQYYHQNRTSPRSPRRQSSTPSLDGEFRSLSICSEPTVVMRQLSGQSSLEPCVLEESPESDDKDKCIIENEINLEKITIKQNNGELKSLNTISANIKDELHTPIHTRRQINTNNNKSNSPIYCNIKKQRPQSLKINPNHIMKISNKSTKNSTKIPTTTTTTKIDEKLTKNISLKRSNSTRTFYRSKSKLINEYDIINRSAEDSSSMSSYSNHYNNANKSGGNDDDFYDSLRVISERRSKILKTESESNSQNNTNEIKEKQQESNIEIISKNDDDDNKNILQDNLENKQNCINNLVSTKEENLNAKETDDAVIENLISTKTITTSIQPQTLDTITIITSNTTHTIPIESKVENETMTQKPLLLSSSSSSSPQSLVKENLTSSIECNNTTNIETSEIQIDLDKDQNEFKTNNSYCNNNCKCISNNCNNSSCSRNNNCNCDISYSKKDPINNSSCPQGSTSFHTDTTIETIRKENDVNIEIESIAQQTLQQHKLNYDNSENNIKCIKNDDKDNNIYVLDDSSEQQQQQQQHKINDKILKNGNDVDVDKIMIYDNRDDIDVIDNNDNNSDSKIQIECSKDYRITIDENVN